MGCSDPALDNHRRIVAAYANRKSVSVVSVFRIGRIIDASQDVAVDEVVCTRLALLARRQAQSRRFQEYLHGRKIVSSPGVFSHLRVVEIGSSAGISYCARLFADFGADVRKVEPPSGDPLRQGAPLTPSGQSAWFGFMNFNKSSVIIDSNDSDAVIRLTTLIEDCNILLDGRDVDFSGCPSIDVAAIRKRRPGLIYLEASWFGGEGPYAGFAATDSTVRALAGVIKLVGPVDGPPLLAPDFQTGILAGLWGFIAAASSELARIEGGTGRSWSLSIFRSTLALTEYLTCEAFARGDVMPRLGINRFWPSFPIGIYETKKVGSASPCILQISGAHSATCSVCLNCWMIRLWS